MRRAFIWGSAFSSIIALKAIVTFVAIRAISPLAMLPSCLNFSVPVRFCEMKQDDVCAHASDRGVFLAESVAGFRVDRADVRAIAFLSAYLVFPADHGENLFAERAEKRSRFRDDSLRWLFSPFELFDEFLFVSPSPSVEISTLRRRRGLRCLSS